MMCLVNVQFKKSLVFKDLYTARKNKLNVRFLFQVYVIKIVTLLDRKHSKLFILNLVENDKCLEAKTAQPRDSLCRRYPQV